MDFRFGVRIMDKYTLAIVSDVLFLLTAACFLIIIFTPQEIFLIPGWGCFFIAFVLRCKSNEEEMSDDDDREINRFDA